MAHRRVLASTVLVAVLCLLGQGLTLSHFLFVQHAECPVHPGEMVELSGASSRQGPVASHQAAGLYAADSDAFDCGTHDHCSVLGRRSESFAAPNVAVAWLAEPPPAPHAPEALTFAAQVARLTVAPKQSPPTC